MTYRLVPLLLLATASATPACAEVTRILRAELDPSGAFAVENLAGSMRVVAGTGDRVVAVATVHAESAELAGAFRLEEVAGRKGVPTLRVRYPLDGDADVRVPGEDGRGLLARWLGSSRSSVEYDGRRVRVGNREGVLMYADVEVQLPRRELDGTLRNLVGDLAAEGVAGRLTFDAASGNIRIAGCRGRIVADTGSGRVEARDVEGSYACDTGSGECVVRGFRGDRLSCDTGSGEIRIEDSSAATISADTGSGAIEMSGVEVRRLDADTGSGSVALELAGDRLEWASVDTGSGSVELRLGPRASFELRADQGSGRLVSRFADADPIVHRRQVVGYRRGDGRTKIEVDTGSGNVTIGE